MKQQITQALTKVVKELFGEEMTPQVSVPMDFSHGDYTTNVSFILSKKLSLPLSEVAQKITSEISKDLGLKIGKIEVAGAGFINFYVNVNDLQERLGNVVKNDTLVGVKKEEKNIMVEYAHPNTHKEMHIGHMRTLITGESVARLLEAVGNTVYRANYQGDIGPHVAKAMHGIQILMREEAQARGVSFDQVFQEKKALPHKERAHFLGAGYVKGNQVYADPKEKEQIDLINSFLYFKVEGRESQSALSPEEQEIMWSMYIETKQWSLDYYDEFYKRFGTKFNHLFLESAMVVRGREVVMGNLGTIFTKSDDGAIIFEGEKYGLHTRVFITGAGNPTYEGKEMGNALTEWDLFHFDKKIHVVANEQAGYFQVIFKALDLIEPEKFEGKQYHLSMGMVQFSDRKMSSRTGDIVTVDDLLDEVKHAASELMKVDVLSENERADALEKVTIGAVKHSVLKVGTGQNAAFDIKTSVSLEGNSGPYVQYSYVRTQSILGKAGASELTQVEGELLPEEEALARQIYHFPDVIEQAASDLAPQVIATYLFELSQTFNSFYQKYRIIEAENDEKKAQRLLLTAAVGKVLAQGLSLLGIEAPAKM